MARTEPGMVSPLARPTKADSSICCQHAGLTPARAAGHLPVAVQGLPPPLRAGPRDERGASPRVGFALPRPWTASTSLSPAPAVAITCRGRGFPSPLSPVARPWKPQGAQGGAQMARPATPHYQCSAALRAGWRPCGRSARYPATASPKAGLAPWRPEDTVPVSCRFSRSRALSDSAKAHLHVSAKAPPCGYAPHR